MAAMTMIYPYKFQPIFKHRLWGGRRLREVFGKETAPDDTIGESWELADLPQDKSVIVNGPLAGSTLAEALERFGEEITGEEYYAGPFGLLIKLLDAQDILSVQVHPDDETCKRMGRGDPKTECWYIIAAEPGAYIYKGIRKGATREQFASAIADGTVAGLLDKVYVEPGQCHYLPAGTVHSIGAGLLIAEIQTPSDTTYRVFDWNRVEADGRARPLHIDEALESIHFDVSAADLPVATVGRLVDCPYFKVDKGHQIATAEVLLSPGGMEVLMFLGGSGRIVSEGVEPVGFAAGDTILIPAIYEGVIRFSRDSEYLRVRL